MKLLVYFLALLVVFFGTTYAVNEVCTMGNVCRYHVDGGTNRLLEVVAIQKGQKYICTLQSTNGGVADMRGPSSCTPGLKIAYDDPHFGAIPLIVHVDATQIAPSNGTWSFAIHGDSGWLSKTYFTLLCE